MDRKKGWWQKFLDVWKTRRTILEASILFLLFVTHSQVHCNYLLLTNSNPLGIWTKDFKNDVFKDVTCLSVTDVPIMSAK
jgi:hypothetical protein